MRLHGLVLKYLLPQAAYPPRFFVLPPICSITERRARHVVLQAVVFDAVAVNRKPPAWSIRNLGHAVLQRDLFLV